MNTLKSNETNETVLKSLEGKKYHVDSLGRIIIEDKSVMDMISGAFSEGMNDLSSPLWNGACSNSRC